ncbi:MAG: hypothetical protein ABW121_14930 [Candidatus Thiodiazotropha sp. 6PLUC7]
MLRHDSLKCVSNGKKSYQDRPCVKVGAPQKNQQHQNQGAIEAVYKKLDFLAYQGYGLSQSRKPKSKSKPSQYVESVCGKPKGWQVGKAYRLCSASALQELTQRKNARSVAQLSNFYDEIKEFCGAKWRQLPSVGMTDEDFKFCSSHGAIKQEVLIDEDGTFAALYVLADKKNNRVYSINGVVTKISTSATNRSFR